MSKDKNKTNDFDDIDLETVRSFPNSEKTYVSSERFNIKVPMRKVKLNSKDKGGNCIFIYDTSGPYTDEYFLNDITKGLPLVRSNWIIDRNDSQIQDTYSSIFSKKNFEDSSLDNIRFIKTNSPRKSIRGKNLTQMHYAKKGIITPEMEYVAISCLLYTSDAADE